MSYFWVKYYGSMPNDAVYAGNDSDGSPMYVGRARHFGDLIPGKAFRNYNSCCIPYDGREHVKTDFEVLCGTGLIWVQSKNGQVPEGAIEGGETSSGETLYVARAKHLDTVTPGKVHRSHKCMYLSYGYEEHKKTTYEVLVDKQKYHPSTDHPFSQIKKTSYGFVYRSSISWVRSSDGNVPQNAIPGGYSEIGETLYIGRTNHQGSLTVGKIQPSHKCIYIPFGGREISCKTYEVMVEN